MKISAALISGSEISAMAIMAAGISESAGSHMAKYLGVM